MIIDTRADVNKPVSVRDIMEHSEIKFYLTGSRYFGNARPDSVWDYFTEDHYATKMFLEQNGFVLKSTAYTNDSSIVEVYHHAGENIHVQFVKDVWIKSFAQQVLISCINPIRMSRMNKITLSDYWRIALAAGKLAKP